jgi:hypothetical protein
LTCGVDILPNLLYYLCVYIQIYAFKAKVLVGPFNLLSPFSLSNQNV